MQMGYGLWQEQSQRLVMTPELRQAITLLQYSSLELLEYLEGELAVNPVIELVEPFDWAEIARQQRDQTPLGPSLASPSEDREPMLRATETLHSHLLQQLRYLHLTPSDRQIGEYLIGNLDDNGYLTLSVAECATALGVTVTAVEQMLHHVQSFEPTGVGARDLAECLKLQLAERGPIPQGMHALIDHYLPDIAQGRITRVAGLLKLTPADVQRMVDLLKTLDPKPGRSFSAESPAFIIPDVQVEKVGGEYVVLVNDRSVPRLRINEFYRTLLQTKDKDEKAKETRDYVTGKLQGALWLFKSLEQRRQTIFQVTTAIVELQRGFFDYGIHNMKPLTLRQVAERVGLHESTVSRATTGKYAQTPRGVYELKYFFNSGVQTTTGEGAAAESIKAAIRQLIHDENPRKPLSDQKIADLLGERGIEIARRTVAKYREEEQLPSSSQRKRHEE